MKRLGWVVAVALVLVAVLLAYAAWSRAELARMEGLRADSLEVVLATTMVGAGRTEARAFQLELAQSALEDSLSRKPRVVVRTRVVIDTMPPDTVRVAVSDTNGERRARFTAYQAPVRLVASVALPAPPETGSIAWQAIVDPIGLQLRLSCGVERPVRRAHVEITGPPWARLLPDSLAQTPEVCNPRPRSIGLALGFGGWKGYAIAAGAGAAILAGLAFIF